MNTMRINEIVYDIPQSWKEVSLRKYQLLMDVDTTITPVKRLLNHISILADIPMDILYDVDITELGSIDLDFTKDFNEKIEPIIEIDMVRYGCVKDMTKLKLGEYSDLDELSHGERPQDNVHKIAAVLMRPIIAEDGELYTIEKYSMDSFEHRANLFLDKMNVAQLLGLTNFFFQQSNIFSENLTHSFNKN